jgi:molybdenum cofactor synthesis domain-containing protein
MVKCTLPVEAKSRVITYFLTYSLGMAYRAKILTVSDSASDGRREDGAGPLLKARLIDSGFEVDEVRVVPDGVSSVASSLRAMTLGFAGLVVTTGGTGFSPRDLTPEGTLQILEREAPGFDELMRATSAFGALSRSRSGTVARCLIVNTPGSPKAAVECLEAVLALVPHALDLLGGGGETHPPETGGSTATSS